MNTIASFWLATTLSCLVETGAVEPAARVTLSVDAPQAGRCELRVGEDTLITALAAVLPEPVTRDHFNHADVALLLAGRPVGAYELVVGAANLVKDGRFEALRQSSPWTGLRRAEYTVKPEPGQPGQAFWAQCAKIQNSRITQPMRLEKDRLYLLGYAVYSDVQSGDVSVQLADPAKTLFATLSHSHRRPLHRQRQWDRRQLLFRADVEQPELRVGTAFMGRAAVADVSLRPARWRLVASLPRAGRNELALTYVPRMGRRLTPPPAAPQPDVPLPAAKAAVGRALAVGVNPEGILLHLPGGQAWTLPSDWPLRVDRLADSRPTKPAARHDVTVARGMDTTVLLAVDLGGEAFRLESLRCSLPLGVTALRLASVPITAPGTFDRVIYRQLDPMVPVNDPLVPFDPGRPTVLALMIQCTGATPRGTHDGDIQLRLAPAPGPVLDVRLPLRVHVLPMTIDAVKHCSCVFGNQHLVSAPRRSPPTFTEDAVSVAAFHGYDPRKRYPKPAENPLLQLARDYVQRMMDFHVQPHAAALMAPISYKVEEVPGGPPRLAGWDFAEYDRSLEMFMRRGGRFITVMHTNGEVVTRVNLNNHTYSFQPAPAGAPRWHQLPEDDYWQLVGSYLEAIAAHLAAKGWLEAASVLIDESAPSTFPAIRRFAQAVRAMPHARRLRLIHSSNTLAPYAMRVSGGAEGPLMLEGVLDVFMPENNDHFNDWPEDDTWPADRGPRPTHWVYYVGTDHLDLPHAGVSTELLPLKCRWLGAEGLYIWGSFIWSMPYARREGAPWEGGAWGPVTNPWINPNYHHGQGLLSFFYPPDPRGPAIQPDPKLTPSYRLALLRDGLQDNALWRIVQAGVDDAGQPVRVPATIRRGLESQLDATWINPTQWRVSRPHHQAWRSALCKSVQAATAPVDIGSRRELFVDDFLVDRLAGRAEFRLHHPSPRERVMVWDAPWEGNTSGYPNVFQDGDRYRMYYRAWQYRIEPGKLSQAHSPMLCLAESRDGIHWTRPELGLVAFRGSKKNNIVFPGGKVAELHTVVSTFTEFKDDNPACPADARYKGLVLAVQPRGLLPFKSADGLRWMPMSQKQVITGDAFDSPNLAFWDSQRGEYRAYYRYVTHGESGNGGIRGVKTATSKDFLHWTEGQPLVYPGVPEEQLYTNQIKPYHRAPHIFLGFPARYLDRGWSDSMRALPDPQHRELRASALERAGTALTETLLMSSRDGCTFKRWEEALLRPGIERPGTWNYGHQYATWHPVETKSALEGAPNELSLYATEDYWTGRGTALRRYTLRIDGFVSVTAPMSGGELVTRPLVFTGNRLELNFSTSAAGSVQVEIQDRAGKPLPGFSLADCPPIFGDSLERVVTWKSGADVGRLAAKPVRLQFTLKDSDIFAFQFTRE